MIKITPIVTGSDGNLYIINSNGVLYLLECGINYNLIIKYLYSKYIYISSFKGCFISHKHIDHSLAIKEINKYMPVYSNPQVMDKYNPNGDILFAKKLYQFNGNLSVMPLNVEHGNAECYAYLFKDNESKILFITDCFKFEDRINTEFDEIFIECNWTENLILKALEETKDTPQYTKFQRQYQTHCSFEALKLILEKSLNLSKCKKITLIHPSKEVCDKELVLNELRELYPNIEIDFAKNLIEGVTLGNANGYF